MAFNPANLSIVAASSPLAFGSNYVWSYTTADNIATVTASGYFDSANADLRSGDLIKVAAGNGDVLVSCSVSIGSGVNTSTL